MIRWGLWCGLLMTCWGSLYFYLRGRRWVRLPWLAKSQAEPTPRYAPRAYCSKKVYPFVCLGDAQIQKWSLVLRDAGIWLHGADYLLAKRVLLVVVVLLVVSGYMLGLSSWLFLGLVLFVLGWLDYTLLGVFGRQRQRVIIHEVHLLSRHLWLLADADMNLHYKLSRGEQLTQKIRTPLRILLNEWYVHPAEALAAFGGRLASEEGKRFADTLQAIYRSDQREMYEVLKERMAEYKASHLIQKAESKETMSYLLFVVASLPILYTFRVFLHPWFKEGQQLLNMI